MSSQNTNRVMAKSNIHINSINRLLKDIKSNVLANFIHIDDKNIMITTNKVTTTLDLNIIEKYIKNVNNVNMNEIISSRLSQSKSYLKILDILLQPQTWLRLQLRQRLRKKWVINQLVKFKNTVEYLCYI